MNVLLKILYEHPYLLLIVVAWVVGAIGNAAKAAKKAKERAEQQRRMPSASRPAAPAAPAPGQRSAEDVAAEMRRILGMEEPLQRPRRPDPAPEPVAQSAPPRVRRDVVTPERPPAPVQPTTQARALEIHVDPHVGDSIKGRHLAASGASAEATKGRGLGALGGRAGGAVHRGRTAGVRFALDDLKKAFVLSEILGPPVSLRGPEERLR